MRSANSQGLSTFGRMSSVSGMYFNSKFHRKDCHLRYTWMRTPKSHTTATSSVSSKRLRGSTVVSMILGISPCSSMVSKLSGQKRPRRASPHIRTLRKVPDIVVVKHSPIMELAQIHGRVRPTAHCRCIGLFIRRDRMAPVMCTS